MKLILILLERSPSLSLSLSLSLNLSLPRPHIPFPQNVRTPSQRWTFSVGSRCARAYSVSLSSNVVSNGSVSVFTLVRHYVHTNKRKKKRKGNTKRACTHTCRAFRYSTICNVFLISGIFCSSPLRLCAVLSSINLYFLQISTVATLSGVCIHVRDGILKLFQRRHNIFVCSSNKFGHVCLPV